ncbi:NAD(P)H-hydrate epimerase [Planctomycetota bacterium]
MSNASAPDSQRVMTREQVRAFDAWVIQELGIPGCVLMENAGRGCADIILSRLSDTLDTRVCIICGVGNNGGDGFVIARHLSNAGLQVTPILLGSADKLLGDAKLNYDILRQLSVKIIKLDPQDIEGLRHLITGAAQPALLVDALFGTGLQGTLRDPYPSVIQTLNAMNIPMLAVDIPSGLDADSGQPLGSAVHAVATVTFVARKQGFLNPSAHKYTGDVTVASIGVEPSVWPAWT